MFARSKILGVAKNGRLNIQPSFHNRYASTAAKKVEASLMGSDLLSNGSAINKSVNSFWQSSYQYMMTGFIPASPDLTDSQALALFYRDMYLHDSVAGSAVDIQSSFPFSDWELRGLQANDLKIYNDSLERLTLQELFPLISTAYLTDGFFAGSLVFDYNTKQFMDVLIHDALSCEIQPSPFHNIDPKITVHTNGQTKAFIDNSSEYTDAYLRTMPAQFIELLKADAFELDPVSTLYVARRVLTDRAYTSYLQRLLPCYLIEKVLFRGTLVEAQRRQRATTHIQAGDDTWTPTDDELHDLTVLFQSTESDPLGAWIATRNNIQLSEFRSAGEMWKWYETAESLTPMKLRSLGISDAFLSGDACLTGDTLIPTKQGLRRIDSFGDSKDTKWHELSVRMDSRLGHQNSTHWRYSGIKQTYRVVTANGNEIKATGNHQVLVFENGEFVWKRTDKLNIGDMLCLSTRSTTSPTNAALPEKPTPRVRKQRSECDKNGQKRGIALESHVYNDPDIRVPRYVNPAFAQWLAMFIAEGWTCREDKATVEGGTIQIGFSNTDKKLVTRFVNLTKKLFGLKASVQVKDKEQQFGQFTCNKDVYNVVVRSRQLVDWLANIGCCMSTTSQLGDSPAKFKVIPDCILQSSARIWKAFLAMYAECDGTYAKNYTITWISASPVIIQQIQAMLSALGYQSLKRETSVTINHEDAIAFAHDVEFVGNKRFNHNGSKSKYSKLFGIPLEHWTTVLKKSKVKFDRHGSYYLTEHREVICHSRNDKGFGFGSDTIRLNYDRFKKGKYDEFLRLLKRVNHAEYEKLIFALKQRYFITPIVSISDNGKQKVYDLSMEGDPSFVANGIVVHNSYAASESAYSTFVETVASYRNHLTDKVFYKKLFPLIAVVNDLYTSDSVVKPDVNNITQFLFNANNRQALRMPKIHWHKQLEARDEQSQFEMLERVAEHGIPVPITTWIAAAGMDIEALIKDLEESKELEKKLEPFQKSGGGEDEDSMFASTQVESGKIPQGYHKDDMNNWTTESMKSQWAKLRRVPILSRKFTDEDNAEWEISTDGKRHLKVHQEAARKDRLYKMAKVISKYNKDPNYRDAIIKANAKRGNRKLKGF